MTIVEYIDTVKGHLLTNPLILHFRVIRERTALANAMHLDNATISRWESGKQKSVNRMTSSCG